MGKFWYISRNRNKTKEKNIAYFDEFCYNINKKCTSIIQINVRFLSLSHQFTLSIYQYSIDTRPPRRTFDRE